jgi:hypothetical protein
MNCAWCGSNSDGSDSHGICDKCAAVFKLQSAWRQLEKTPSYVDGNIAAFASESMEESLAYFSNCPECSGECSGHAA